MEQGIAEILGSRPAHPRIVRTLWRMQGPSRIIAARIERHPFGRELVIVFEGNAEDVIETRFERVSDSRLESRADQLRELLAAKGWPEIKASAAPGTAPEEATSGAVNQWVPSCLVHERL